MCSLHNDISQLKASQRQIIHNQQQIWSATRQLANKLQSTMRVMAICTEFLYRRTQLNLLRNTLTSRLQQLLSSLQSYRIALWTYRLAILDAIPSLADGLLPMSLVPRTVLLQILDDVNAHQARQSQHLSLALTLDNLAAILRDPTGQASAFYAQWPRHHARNPPHFGGTHYGCFSRGASPYAPK